MAVLLDAFGRPGEHAAGRRAAAARRPPRALADHPAVQAALAGRNANLAQFWLAGQAPSRPAPVPLPPSRVLVIDAEDEFVAMLGHQLRSFGQEVVVRGYREPWNPQGFDVVVVGPGPGDPCDQRDPKMAALRRMTWRLLVTGTPFLSVCLGHQVLASCLGLPVVRKQRPNQGTQLPVDLFGERYLAGFYNTFAAVSSRDRFVGPSGRVEVGRDPATGEVHSLRGPRFRSVQFHAESILTQRGVAILRELLWGLLDTAGERAATERS
jgi:phenazine biosynthesis protein phzE